ncbi:hypothetical protein OIU77_030960 [Salix suchowensis]|uniref:Uncharacterized protein n=1 Tax=Salix suchowensis TaxID=1278906 RepID=A0ABQ9BHB0_9ROSI|nr:hypothetical protein OIU77_030960 [Salix suchowensis]
MIKRLVIKGCELEFHIQKVAAPATMRTILGVESRQMDEQIGIYEKKQQKTDKAGGLEAMEFKVVKDSRTSRQFRPDHRSDVGGINQARYFVFGLTC